MKVLRKAMLSGRQAADYLNLSDNTFMKAIEGGYLVPQMELKRPPRKVERGFVVAYLREVKKVLPDTRIQRSTIFTEEVIKKLEPINKEWDGKEDVDWKKDAIDTTHAMAAIKKR